MSPPTAEEPVDERPGLFDATPEIDVEAVVEQFAEQRRRISGDARLELLTAAESAGTLAAAEMGFDGLPFSAQAHRRLLEDTLGPRPTGYDLPSRIAEVVEEISAAFGRTVNPASHSEVLEAFRREGITVESTRKHVLQRIDHPAVPLLLRHRELSKLYSTNGWHWLDTWVRDDRFRPVYVPGAVVSGRWASRGGGALQIPKALRSSVIADRRAGRSSSPTRVSSNRASWRRCRAIGAWSRLPVRTISTPGRCGVSRRRPREGEASARCSACSTGLHRATRAPC